MNTKTEKGPSNLLDYVEAAAYLRISEHTLRLWVKDRKIPCIRVGRFVRFTPELLDRWLEGKTSGLEEAGEED